jgi:hypothetical protein
MNYGVPEWSILTSESDIRVAISLALSYAVFAAWRLVNHAADSQSGAIVPI